MDYSKYDDIRPLLPHEVPTVIAELMENAELRAAYESLGTGIAWDDLRPIVSQCKTVADFKKCFSSELVRFVMKHTCASVSPLLGTEHIDKSEAYTYISNHRDIILDSAFLNVLTYEAGAMFPEIAIGDNLLVAPWVESLVKLNGNFLVRRNLQGREVLLAAKQLSGYMQDAVAAGISTWIAQREGRAKDADDRTQPALLKMLSLAGGERGLIANLKKLNILPLTCSYEYDPCDYLKAREMQMKRDNPDYKKTKAEDALNMRTGVMGYKGRVVFTLGRPLNALIEAYDWDTVAESDRPEAVAAIMDKEIHRNYTLYPANYIAWDRLTAKDEHTQHYTHEDVATFDAYLAKQLSRITMPEGYEADEAFLTSRILEMYANPAINHHKALGT